MTTRSLDERCGKVGQAGRPVLRQVKGQSRTVLHQGDLVKFVGHAPLEATVFEMERRRCNACGQVFTADAPATAGPDKYDATAVATG